MWYVVLTFKDDIFRSDFMRSFMQFQHHNITSDKLSDQNNEILSHILLQYVRFCMSNNS